MDRPERRRPRIPALRRRNGRARWPRHGFATRSGPRAKVVVGRCRWLTDGRQRPRRASGLSSIPVGQCDRVGSLFDTFRRELRDPVLSRHVGKELQALVLEPDLSAARWREPLRIALGNRLIAFDELLHGLLVVSKGSTVVTLRSEKFVRQYVGTDQGEAAALARQWRGAVAGVAEERDSPGRPPGHPDLAHGIKVEVRGLPHGSEQPGYFPALE